MVIEIPTRSTIARRRKRTTSPADRPLVNGALVPLPPAVLLLCLPALFPLPPAHKHHVASLALALSALRKCLSLPTLPPDLECRASTAFAELGLSVTRARMSQRGDYAWAGNIENEVERAIGRGLLLAQKNASLTIYHHTLTLLHIRLSNYQQNDKFSRALLKRLTNTLSTPTPTPFLSFGALPPPPWLLYAAHLTAIAHALARTPPDFPHVFATLQALHESASAREDPHVVLLGHVLRLRALVDAGMWADVGGPLALAESVLGLSYDAASPAPLTPGGPGARAAARATATAAATSFVAFEDPFEAAMVVHVLVMGVVFYTHAGVAREASPRLSHLHALMDSDVLSKFPVGTIDIKLKTGPPLTIKVTHPRVLYLLAYLVSSASKRDAAGRKPKRKVFATEGLLVWEREVKKEVQLPAWATLQDLDEVDERMVKIKADLLSELVAVSIMRSEFDEAESHLAQLIAHTRTHLIFPTYAARITLHHAHLAHALGAQARAGECYAAARHLAGKGTYEHAAAGAGALALRVGMRARLAPHHGRREGWEEEEEVRAVVEACAGMGGALEAVAHVLQAGASREILAAKNHLKAALDLASRAQDNHLRALVLALIAGVYMRTASEHAGKMLETCGQLAAGLGAPAVKRPSGAASGGSGGRGGEAPVGNAPLGLWVGQRFLELYKRAGEEAKVRRQEAANALLEEAVAQLDLRCTRTVGAGVVT